MKNVSKIIVVFVFCCPSVLATAQIIIRDHRKDKTKWMPTRPPSRDISVGQPDTELVPVSISNFRIDPTFRDEIIFKYNDWGVLTNNINQVFFSSKLLLENAVLNTIPTSNRRDLLFFTDTLVIDGISELDLSKNA